MKMVFLDCAKTKLQPSRIRIASLIVTYGINEGRGAHLRAKATKNEAKDVKQSWFGQPSVFFAPGKYTGSECLGISAPHTAAPHAAQREKAVDTLYDPARQAGSTREIMESTASKGRSKVSPMTIELKPEQERILREALRQGRFHSVEEALDRAIRSIAPQEQSSIKSEQTPAKKSLSQFLMDSPLAGSGLNLERDKDPGRTIEL